MSDQVTTPTLQVGDTVYVPLHDFIKESSDYINGDQFMHTFYGSTGTVVKTHMIEEGVPNYALVHFNSIGGLGGGVQMLMRHDMVHQGPGAWAIRKR